MVDLLPDHDIEFLRSKGFDYEAHVEGDMIALILSAFRLPDGYAPQEVDLLLRLHPSFPQVAPDMFWVAPTVTYTDGSAPPQTQEIEVIAGRTWQRWSRHFTTSPWRPDRDDLRSYLRLIRSVLENEVKPHAHAA